MDADTKRLASAAYRHRLAVKVYLQGKNRASKYGNMNTTGEELDRVLKELQKAVIEGVKADTSNTATGSPPEDATSETPPSDSAKSETCTTDNPPRKRAKRDE